MAEFPGWVGPTGQNEAPLSAQRAINLFPELMEVQSGKGRYAYKNTPGFSQFADLSSFASPEFLFVVPEDVPANDRLFALADTDLVEISSAGSPTDRGNIVAGAVASVATNAPQGDELILTANGGTNVYKYVLSTDTLSAVSGTPSSVLKFMFLEGYIVAIETGTQKFFISALYDVGTWDSSDFGTAEADPDEITDGLVDHRQLMFGGPQSIQTFQNTGNPDFPFEAGPVIQYGVLPGSMVRHDNSVMFIGQQVGDGSGADLSVYRLDGYNPIRVSTVPIEILLNSLTQPKSCKCFSYTEEGHTFYVIAKVTPTSGSSLTTSLAYDSQTGLWHEWAHWSSGETYEELGIVSYVYAFGKHLVTVNDSNFKGVYEIDRGALTDALAPAANSDDEIKWLRRAPHIAAERNRLIVDQVRVNINTGERVEFKSSFDGGTTFGSGRSVTADARGAQINALGSGRDFVLQATGKIDTQAITMDGASIRARAVSH